MADKKKPKIKKKKQPAGAGPQRETAPGSGRKKAEAKAAAGAYPPVVALDVGTTKIACLIGEVNDEGELSRITGIGHHPAKGMHKGVVVDLEDAAESIGASVSQAAQAAGVDARAAFVGVAGAHVVSMNRKVSLTNANEDRRVTRAEQIGRAHV